MFVLTTTNKAVQGNTDPFLTLTLAIMCVVLIGLLIWAIIKRV